jgi:ABC-type multidrug transport system permease subunit
MKVRYGSQADRQYSTMDCTMKARWFRVFLIIGTALSPVSALYCLGGIVTAGSLFTGEHAQRNFEFWGILFLVSMLFFIGFGVTLAVSIGRGKRDSGENAI